MNINSDNVLESILESLSRIDYIHPADIPNIELYMDQVTTFMDAHLSSTKRYEEDKILTKTMINNYAKNNLMPPPNKKKYSREHILVLTFIYYFKNILAIKDIETLLKPLLSWSFFLFFVCFLPLLFPFHFSYFFLMFFWISIATAKSIIKPRARLV